tara:strand:- start:10680 stop:11429 length:750 start_codon:yes stop_codon:yes gene_type:complete
MSYLKGVYWDLDGTIANTELEAHLPAFNKSFAELGLNWYWDSKTYIDLLKINGGLNRIIYYAKEENKNISKDFATIIHKTKQFFYLKLIDEGAVSLKEGVLRLTSELTKKKVRQFIVTSSSRIQVDLLIKNLFKDYNPFEFCITSEDVDYLKPNPFPYLKAINLSKINENNSIVFEDSNPGLISSSKAKLPTICVSSNIPISYEKGLDLKCIISSLGEINNPSNIILGPELKKDIIDYYYLDNFLQGFN